MGIHSHDEIAKVAYELYVNGGFMQGRDLEYWLEAERIVEAEVPSASDAQKKVRRGGRKSGHGGREAAKNARRPMKSIRT